MTEESKESKVTEIDASTPFQSDYHVPALIRVDQLKYNV